MDRVVTKGLDRVLGPAAEEVSEALRRYTARQLRNVARVAENAAGKTPDTASGVPSLRAAMRILDEGSWAEDGILVEYLGGVLASSRTPTGRDDRGVTFAALISRLSCYQLRCHYVLYAGMKRCLAGAGVTRFSDAAEVRDKATFFMPFEPFYESMEFDGSDEDAFLSMMDHTMHNLTREGLLSIELAGDPEIIATSGFYTDDREGMIISPTVPGLELYLWAHGLGHMHVDDIGAVDTSPFDGGDLQPEMIRIAR